MAIELSVIIVNYNGKKFLKACLDSLYSRLKGIPSEIIIVDNNSSDGSCEFIKNQYPDVILLESKENLGFGRGNNEGVKAARGQYLLLINNDTIVQDDLLPVLKVLWADKTIGAIGIKMLNADGKYLLSAGRFPSWLTLTRLKNLGNIHYDFATARFKEEAYEVDWLSGSFLMMPKEVYHSVNGFDSDYFMYVEDVDLNKKIANKGYRRVFLPGYSYIHFVGYNRSKDPLIIQGWQLYVSKHARGFKKSVMLGALQFNRLVKSAKNIQGDRQ